MSLYRVILIGYFCVIKFNSAFQIGNVDFDTILQTLIPTTQSTNLKCQNHSLFYLEELKNLKLWATELFDASSKFPSGVLYGSSVDFGNFDECIGVKIPIDNEQITGQYCMAKFHITPPESVQDTRKIKSQLSNYPNDVSTWEKIIAFSNDRSRSTRNEFLFSFCLPSSCYHQDLDQSLKTLTEKLNLIVDFKVNVTVDSKHCQVKDESPLTNGDKIFIGIVGFFALLVILATLYEWFTMLEDLQKFRFTGTSHRFVRCFSVWTNVKKLNKRGCNNDNLSCVHGLKVMSMFLVIMGHRFMFGIGSPVQNPNIIEEVYGKLEATVLLNGPIIVDTFFNISGFLACYLMLRESDKLSKGANFLIIYLHRIIRLTPAYAVVLGFYCTIFIKIGDGPLWPERVLVEQERCIASWWTNLLYVNNYINTDKICMFQSWYMTCDMHFFLAAPIIVWMLSRKPILGIGAIVAIVLLSISAVFATVYMNNEDGILLLYKKLLRDPVSSSSFKNIYIPTHMRASPYFVGMLAGYIKYKMRTTGYKLSKYMVYFGWVASIVVLELTVYSAFIFYMPGSSYNPLVSATYAALHHFTWSICISWMIIAVSEGNGAWIDPIFSWQPFVPLSKITYSAFLCHGAIQIYTTASLRQPLFARYINWISFALSDIVLAYIFGTVISMLFEAPILGLEKIVFGKRRKQEPATVTKISVINNNE